MQRGRSQGLPFADVLQDKGSPPLRASTANGVVKRGNLPSISRTGTASGPLREPLGYHSWGPSGGPGRWAPGFPAIWKQDSQQGTGRNLKSASTPKRTGGTTQIVMFPTSTHAVPLQRTRTESSLSSSSLPHMGGQRNLKLSASAPGSLTLCTIEQKPLTSENLAAAAGARAQTADNAMGLSLKARKELHAHATSPVGPKQRRIALVSPLTFKEDEDDKDDEDGSSETDSSGLNSERRDDNSQFLDSPVTMTRRRTFHHAYTDLGVSTEVGCMSESIRSRSPSEDPLGESRSPRDYTQEDPEEEECRNNFRQELLRASGCGPVHAFMSLDLNRNGQLCLQEFADGISRLCAKWQEATGRKTLKEVWKLFANKDGVVRMLELFPGTEGEMSAPDRMSTPEFWTHWCRSSPKNGDGEKRGAKWNAANQEEELDCLFKATHARQEVGDRKRWMCQTIRRMKKQGRSDARCREMCAVHLPRGTGPRDVEFVHSFTEQEVKGCRKVYSDAVSGPMRRIQKQVYAMREQRLELHSASQEMKRMNHRNQRAIKQQKRDARRTPGGMPASGDMDDFDEDDDEEEGSFEAGKSAERHASK